MASSISFGGYHKYAKELGSSMKSAYEDRREIVNAAVTKNYAEEGTYPDDEGVLDVG